MAAESFNIKTAAAYINNLLLARGLLRDGKAIEFAHPSRAEGGKEVTMSQIINLVHDLILKRDRDQEHRESIASTLRALRTDTTRQTLTIEKLQTRNEDLARQLSLAQSQERSARAALRTAESSARSLREEMLRLKITVQQVRTTCANDIRKRDVQIQRLKSHLTSQQRGNKSGLVGASITIHPGSMGVNGAGMSKDDGPDVDDPEYSLKQETTEFLTQLSQNLSDENDNLIGLVRSTLMTLRELQGISDSQRQEVGEELSTIGEEDEPTRQGMLHTLPTSYDTLATDMDGVLENLKSLLTNPNFVSIEEVELREEEILKLRSGWEKMEIRWRDTLALMEKWRKRIASGDNTIKLEELKLGLGLGGEPEAAGEGVSTVSEEDEGTSSVFDEVLDEDIELEDPPSPEPDDIPERTSGTDMFKLKVHPQPPALREINGNKSPVKSPRKVAFSASIPNTPSQLGDENGVSTPDERSSRSTCLEERTPRYAKKRLSSPHAHPDEPSPKLTVQDKLKVAQAEAEAAATAVAEGLHVDSRGSSKVNGGEGVEGEQQQEQREEQQQRRSPAKRTRISGRPKRRKSTLTPEELQNLLGV
ncbi:Afadin and alpha-actinin-binding-domain-containing protein [Dendryphion nanum]|uniref:Afadin and alpha-actinin-binding-domain-containing protein n=1 Tax=Dendryphion nanum TaxID=256645 RepID=A0A9P9EJJ2_9PLEO|nr:Afadin and alpha-actinin-binding-domain-containing protein [Dendryphion nanum]